MSLDPVPNFNRSFKKGTSFSHQDPQCRYFFFEPATLVCVCIVCCIAENIEAEERRYWNISKNKFILCNGCKLEPVAFLSLSYLMQFFFYLSILRFLSLFLHSFPPDKSGLYVSRFSMGNRSETEYQKIIAFVRVYKFLPAILWIETFIKLGGKRIEVFFSHFPRSLVNRSCLFS